MVAHVTAQCWTGSGINNTKTIDVITLNMILIECETGNVPKPQLDMVKAQTRKQVVPMQG